VFSENVERSPSKLGGEGPGGPTPAIPLPYSPLQPSRPILCLADSTEGFDPQPLE
jgi:hypothetical protein